MRFRRVKNFGLGPTSSLALTFAPCLVFMGRIVIEYSLGRGHSQQRKLKAKA